MINRTRYLTEPEHSPSTAAHTHTDLLTCTRANTPLQTAFHFHFYVLLLLVLILIPLVQVPGEDGPALRFQLLLLTLVLILALVIFTSDRPWEHAGGHARGCDTRPRCAASTSTRVGGK